ncbi:MAG: hypothetical protein ACLT0Y_07890 [Christensenellales bacterium]
MIEPLSQPAARPLLRRVCADKPPPTAKLRARLLRAAGYIWKKCRGHAGQRPLLYHGIAEIGKRHNIMPHRKWRRNSNCADSQLSEAMAQAACRWIPLRLSPSPPGTSEQVALMTVPLIERRRRLRPMRVEVS